MRMRSRPVRVQVAAAPATWQLSLAEPAASQREDGGTDVAIGVPFALEAEARDRFNNRRASCCARRRLRRLTTVGACGKM